MMNKTKSFVNVKRLMGQIQHFFKKPEAVILEIAQNASRSDASELKVEIKNGVLTAEDNGHGVDDPAPLFVLSESAWEEDIQKSHMAAGFGLFALYSISEVVTFESRFGRITVDCKNFMGNEEYRANLFDRVENTPCEGFKLTAVLKPDVVESFKHYDTAKLQYFPFKTVFNGEAVPQRTVETAFPGHFDIKTSYMSNPVYINAKECSYSPSLLVIWYGIPIGRGYFSGSPDIIVDVKFGSPLTPVLPYRDCIKEDKRLSDFTEFARQETLNYCIAKINGDDLSDRDAIDFMKAAGTLARSNDELDCLNRFYVTESNPYHCIVYSDSATNRIVKYGDAIISETVESTLVTKNGDQTTSEVLDFDESDIILPQETIRNIYTSRKQPTWLSIQDKKVSIQILPRKKKAFNGYCSFTWQSAQIKCDGKDISVVFVGDSSSGVFYYSDKPHDISEIDEALFEHIYYDSDSDYDPQKDSWDENINHDVMKITKTYDKHTLLCEVGRYSGIETHNIKSITVEKGSIVVVSHEGKKSRLKIAG